MTQINADDATPGVAIVNDDRCQRLLEAERELLRTRLQRASAAASARAAHLPEEAIEELIERSRVEAYAEADLL